MTNNYPVRKKGLSGFSLRVIAAAAMTWGCLQKIRTSQTIWDWETYMLWFSYTIFAFLLAEGFNRSSDRVLYFRRLVVFGAISEVSYDYLNYSSYFNTESQSIMCTILVSYAVMCITEAIREKLHNRIITLLVLAGLSYLGTLLCIYINAQFAAYGVYIAAGFYLSLKTSYSWIIHCAGFALLIYTVDTENYFSITINSMQYLFPYTVVVLPAIVMIWLYSRKRGPNAVILKIFYYMYFPLMMFGIYKLREAGFTF